MAKHYDKQFKLDVVQYYHEKKQSIFWKMTEAIYLEVTEMAETAHKAKRRVSVSGMLKHLCVSRSVFIHG